MIYSFFHTHISKLNLIAFNNIEKILRSQQLMSKIHGHVQS